MISAYQTDFKYSIMGITGSELPSTDNLQWFAVQDEAVVLERESLPFRWTYRDQRSTQYSYKARLRADHLDRVLCRFKFGKGSFKFDDSYGEPTSSKHRS